jgi:hypothetical protein
MRNKLWRWILSAVGLAFFIVLAAGSMETEEKVEESVRSQSAAITVSASQLYSDYKANEVAADQRYKDKVLQVSGTVDNIGKDIMDSIYVTLETGTFGSIQCFFADKHASEAAQLRKGQSITVKGRCDGKMMNVLLKGCVIVR